jgi:hypothetical protein
MEVWREQDTLCRITLGEKTVAQQQFGSLNDVPLLFPASPIGTSVFATMEEQEFVRRNRAVIEEVVATKEAASALTLSAEPNSTFCSVCKSHFYKGTYKTHIASRMHIRAVPRFKYRQIDCLLYDTDRDSCRSYSLGRFRSYGSRYN